MIRSHLFVVSATAAAIVALPFGPSESAAQVAPARYDIRTPSARRETSVGRVDGDSSSIQVGAAREGGYPQVIVQVTEIRGRREFYAEVPGGDAHSWADSLLRVLTTPFRPAPGAPRARQVGGTAVDFSRERAFGFLENARDPSRGTFRMIMVRDDHVYMECPLDRTQLLQFVELFVRAIDVADSLSVVDHAGRYRSTAPLLQQLKKARTP